MTLKRFLFPTYADSSAAYSALLLALRVLFGLLFLSHGYDKLMAHATMAPLFADPFGMGSTISFWMVVFAEVVCSFAVILGILQRLAVIPMIVAMCVAFFVVHGGDPFALREPSFIYLMVFLLLLFTGPGRLSFDAVIGNEIFSDRDA